MRIARIEDQEGRIGWAKLVGPGARWLSREPWLGADELEEVRSPFRLLAPVVPSKIVCIGKNYARHAAEMNSDVPKTPLLFLKPPSSLIGPNDTIVLPAQSQRVEHEAELGVVVCKRMKHVPESEVLAHVFGYVVLNDVTARDLQRSDVQFTRAKGFDTFCPVGPWIETELDPENAILSLDVDGETRQHGTSADMVHSVARLLAFISTVMTLEPGDLVATGTPEGVGPLVDGNFVRVRIDGIGELENPVRAERREG